MGKGDFLNPNAWINTASSISTGTPAVPAAHGDVQDVSTEPGDPDRAYGLIAWAAGDPTLGVAAIAAPTTHGDVSGAYGVPDGGILEFVTWAPSAPTIGVGAIPRAIGKGDLTDPYAWEDSITYFTSQIYPVLVLERLQGAGNFLYQPQYEYVEHLTGGGLFLGGTLNSSLIEYTDGAIEHITGLADFSGGTLVLGLFDYTDGAIEHVTGSADFNGGVLTLALITYTNWPVENITASGDFTGGVLT